MLYYLGKGKVFKKEECKEYKTKDGALKAMAKTDDGVVWDESGQFIASVVDVEDVPEGALQDNPDGSINTYDEDGNKTGTITAEEAAAVAGGLPEDDAEGQQDSVTIPEKMTRATVVCDGSLNLRRSPHWGDDNICGRAVKGQSYYVKAIHTVDGKKMVRTIDDIYLSAAPEHVRIEQL